MYASCGLESEQQAGSVLDEVGRTGTWSWRTRGCLGCPPAAARVRGRPVVRRRQWRHQRGGGDVVVLPTTGTLGSRVHPLATEEQPDPEPRNDRNAPEPDDGMLDEA